MVLPATEIGMRQQERRLDRINQKARTALADESVKKVAKSEVRKALDRVRFGSRRGSSRRLGGQASSVSSLSIHDGTNDRDHEHYNHSSTNSISRRDRMSSVFSRSEMTTIQEEERAGATSPGASAGASAREKNYHYSTERQSRTYRLQSSPKKTKRGFRWRLTGGGGKKKAKRNKSTAVEAHASFLTLKAGNGSNTEDTAHHRPGTPSLSGALKQGASTGLANRMFADPTSRFSRTKDISREAWMCGVCGKVFASFEVAEAHENRCMLDVLGKLDTKATKKNGKGVDPQSGAQTDKHETVGNANRPTNGTEHTGQDDNESHDENDDTDQLLVDLGLDDRPESYPTTPDLKEEQSPFRRTSKASKRGLQVSTGNESIHDNGNGVHDNREDDAVVKARRDGLLTPRIGLRHDGRYADSDKQANRSANPRFNSINIEREETEDILLTHQLRQTITVTDEAVASVVKKAIPYLLTPAEVQAERDLCYLAQHKQYYDSMTARASALKTNPLAKFRTDGKNFVSKVQNKFVDAYQLIKEGDSNEDKMDMYTNKDRDGALSDGIQINNRTHYVNVVVRQSALVVNNELQRLAKKRWEEKSTAKDQRFEQFERFRAFAQGNLVALAAAALASDFTPRKVAVQLSNDLYRLIGPQLKRRGVRINTEIQYRVGPYFILAVNVEKIDWIKLIKFTHKSDMKRRRAWEEGHDRREELNETEDDNESNGWLAQLIRTVDAIRSVTAIDFIAQMLAWLYYVHWSVSVPICVLAYRVLMPSRMTKYILSTVTDGTYRLLVVVLCLFLFLFLVVVSSKM